MPGERLRTAERAPEDPRGPEWVVLRLGRTRSLPHPLQPLSGASGARFAG